jgi:hypothetical protein
MRAGNEPEASGESLGWTECIAWGKCPSLKGKLDQGDLMG